MSRSRKRSVARYTMLSLGVVVAILHSPRALHAQFTDPRTYQNAPVSVNQLLLQYTYARANASLDTSLIVVGAEVSLHQGTVDYTRYFSFLHRTTWVEASFPFAGLNGSVSGSNLQRTSNGKGDSSYTTSMLLWGGPALSVAQFENYTPTTSVGVSLTVTAPTGRYNADKVLNLGSDRWSFKPEIGISHPFGHQKKWVVDAYVNASFFTDNRSYRGQEILRQKWLPGVEAHVSYSLSSRVWASLDTRYSFRGETVVDGTNQNNAQQNFVLGSELNVSLNSQNSVVFELAKALVHQNGPESKGFSFKYLYTWGKGYR